MEQKLPTTAKELAAWPRRATLLLIGWGLGPAALGQTASFAPVVNYLSGTGRTTPTHVAVADVNGDGKLDAVVANYGTSTLGVLLGNGSGGFTLQANQPSTGTGANTRMVVIADVNNDGKPDVLATNYTTSTLAVLLGDGTGNFTLRANSPSTAGGGNPIGLAVADINGDGKRDAVVANYGDYTLSILLGDGTGNFALQAAMPSTSPVYSRPVGVVLADVNADGKLDALTANSNAGTLGVLLGNGAGSFALQANLPATGPLNGGPTIVAVADVNRDGKPDAVVSNSQASTLAVLLGNGAGGFTLQTPSRSPGVNSQPLGVAVADVNGDGNPDALTASVDLDALSVFVGAGNGTFILQSAPTTGAGTGPNSVVLADVNGDGRPDALVSNYGTGTLGVLLNTTPLATTAALPGASATLAPNPTHAAATLTATGLPAAARRLDATLYNALGGVVRRLAVPAAAGSAQAAVPTAGLPAGVYLLRLAALDAQGTTLGQLPTQRLAVE